MKQSTRGAKYIPTDKLQSSDTWFQAVPYSKIVAFTLVSYTQPLFLEERKEKALCASSSKSADGTAD